MPAFIEDSRLAIGITRRVTMNGCYLKYINIFVTGKLLKMAVRG